ncbi:MAG: hypothetical protein JJT78_11295 [Leptospira sp.]|nr:hypothetical protein [Leptospira sp.]
MNSVHSDQYLSKIQKIQIGKRIGYEYYFHKSYLSHLESETAETFSKIAGDFSIPHDNWNILKIHKKIARLSYLFYPGFDKEPYPELVKSHFVDLLKKSCKILDYSQSSNPPILHRKELFVPEDYLHYREFEQITGEAEKNGLYSGDNRKIGYKKQWMELLSAK